MNDRKNLEKIGNGYTNRVYKKENGNILKTYSSYSLGSIVHVFRTFMINFRLSGVNGRIYTENKVREILGSKVKFPQIIDSGDDWIEMGFIEGESVNDILDENHDCEQIGAKVGNLMKIFEENDIYMMDWALDDLILVENELAVLDLEFAEINGNFVNKMHGRASIFVQTATKEKEVYEEFLEGLRNEINLTKKLEFLGLLLGFWFNLTYFWENGKPIKVASKIPRLLR